MPNSQNLKPWPKGVSGNPEGRQKTKLTTDQLVRLLGEEAPTVRTVMGNGDCSSPAASGQQRRRKGDC